MNESDAFEFPEENIHVLGAFFGTEREKRGFSLRGISRSTNITPTLISDIENQKVKSNLETLVTLYKSLDISLITDRSHLNAVKDNITAFYHAIYETNKELTQKLTESLIPQFEVLKFSLLSIDLILAKAMMDVEIKKDHPKDDFLSLNKHLSFFNDFQRQKYYLILGQYHLQNNEFKKAKSVYKKAIKIPYQKRGYAVAYDALAYIESRTFHPFKAIEYAETSSKIHGKYSNLFKKIHADFILIKSYIELFQFEKAEALIYNLSFVLVESNQPYYLELQAFKAYLSYIKKDYQQALIDFNGMKELNVFQVFLIIMVYRGLNQEDQAKDVIIHYETSYQKKQDEMALSLITIAKTQFMPDENALSAIDYFINHFEAYHHLQVIKELIGLSEQYLYQNKDLERLHKLHQISINIMNFSFS